MQKWSDILFDQDLIYIWSSKRTPEEKELDYIPMDAELKELLLEWKENQPMETEYVFVNEDPKSKGYDKPFKDRRRFMHNACEQAGVPYFGFHAIRRLAAMQLLDAGHPMSYIQRILRHKHENTTAQFTYEVLTRSCAEITGTF
jgi:integrase